jgi:hypothetical protein
MLRRRSATLILLLAAWALPDTSAKLDASPLAPNVTASLSTNGRFLVVTERQYDNPDPHVVRRILRTTYRVMETEAFLNSKDRLSSPARFWSDRWQVTIDGNDGSRVFWPLISNDGESLVLIGVTWASPGTTALKIYRKAIPEGILIRSVPITDLWTSGRLDPEGRGVVKFTDASPEWFAGGSLAFSQDDRMLLYSTQWGDCLSIALADGAVSRNGP